MGLLGRLAKLGGGFIRQVITRDDEAVDEILADDESRAPISPRPTPHVPEVSPAASSEDSPQAENAPETPPSSSVPDSPEIDAEKKDPDNEDVQSTERDGNRRSL